MTKDEWDKIKWNRIKKKLLFKVKRGALGNFTLLFEDTIHNCILHEYTAPSRLWQRWELEVVYGIFRMQLKEMIE